MKATGPTNIYMRLTTSYLTKKYKEHGAKIWKAIGKMLLTPKRKRVAVNLSRINRHTKENDVVVVPGKVLGAGSLDHKVVIGAWSYSKTALEKIRKVGGTPLSLKEIADKYPTGKNIKIMR